MNRRSFLSRTLGAIAAATCAPLVSLVTPEKPIVLGLSALAPLAGTYGAIDRATYSFWRNQQATGVKGDLEPIKMNQALMAAYKDCQ